MQNISYDEELTELPIDDKISIFSPKYTNPYECVFDDWVLVDKENHFWVEKKHLKTET